MGILSSGFNDRERRNFSTNPENPSTPWDVVAGAWGTGQHVSSGVAVNEQNALKYSVVYACVRVVSETIALSKCCVYRERPDGTKIEAKGYPLYRTLARQANPIMNAFIWREVMATHLLLWGNSYSRIEENPDGSVNLWPLQPNYMKIDMSSGDLKYVYNHPNSAGPVTFNSDEILHMKGISLDGIAGMGPVQLARSSIGYALAMEEYGGKWFSNGARPGGVLESPNPLSPAARENLRKGFETRHQGVDAAHRVALLENGVTYKPVQMDPAASQFLESRQFSVEEICRWFRVPPRKVMHIISGNGDSNSIEEQGIEFVRDAIHPWVARMEAAIQEQLIGVDSRYCASFNLDELMRADLGARYNAYALGIQWGFLTANDARKGENMAPIDDGDIRLVPINMTTPEGMQKTVAQIGKQPPAPKPGSPPNPGQGGPATTAPGTQPPMAPANQNPRSLTLADECKGILGALRASQGDLKMTATAFYHDNGASQTREAVLAAIEKGGDRDKILARVSGVLGGLRQKEES